MVMIRKQKIFFDKIKDIDDDEQSKLNDWTHYPWVVEIFKNVEGSIEFNFHTNEFMNNSTCYKHVLLCLQQRKNIIYAFLMDNYRSWLKRAFAVRELEEFCHK